MRAQSLLLGRAPSIFHLRPPTHPQKNNPRCIHTSPMLSQRCLTSIPPHPLSSRLPARPAFGSASTTAGFFFLVISSARSRCARDYCEMKVGGEGARGRKGGAERESESRGPSLSAGVKMVTSAGRRVGDRCADCTYCLECVSSQPKPGRSSLCHHTFFFFFFCTIQD